MKTNNRFRSRVYAQEKACKQEDRLIAKLQELDMDTNLVGVLRRQAIVLLDGGPTSGLGLGVHRDSIPMHTFARFLFVALLDYYPDLAYEVGLRAMRCVYKLRARGVLHDDETMRWPRRAASSLISFRVARRTVLLLLRHEKLIEKFLDIRLLENVMNLLFDIIRCCLPLFQNTLSA